jgi:pyruvate kinase
MYQIIASLGPTSNSPEIWQELLDNGCTAFRINTSHLELVELQHLVERLTAFLRARASAASIFLDLQGSKWRLGRFPTFGLEKQQVVELVLAETLKFGNTLPVPHQDFFKAAQQAEEIALNDAKIRIRIESWSADRLVGRVLDGGDISARKGVTLPGTAFRQEMLNPRDAEIVHVSKGGTNVGFAVSFIKDGFEMAVYRKLMGPETHVIAKLERQSALLDIDAIAGTVNELWLCRGDLGAEAGLAAMARLTAELNLRVKTMAKPVYLAGQVLDHMTTHPQPTRSEVCHLYDMLQWGYRGVILSDETAVGQYPVASCKMAALFRE